MVPKKKTEKAKLYYLTISQRERVLLKNQIAKAIFDGIEEGYEEVFDDADRNFLAISKSRIEWEKKKWLE